MAYRAEKDGKIWRVIDQQRGFQVGDPDGYPTRAAAQAEAARLNAERERVAERG